MGLAGACGTGGVLIVEVSVITSKQSGFLSGPIFLALAFVLLVASYYVRSEARRVAREHQDAIMDTTAKTVAAQMNAIREGVMAWLNTAGEPLLFPGCARYDNCMVGIKRNLLPGYAAELRASGGFAPGFARHPSAPTNNRFFAPTGGQYKAGVVKVPDPSNPGNFIYHVAVWLHEPVG